MNQIEMAFPPRPNPPATTARAEREAGIAASAAGAEQAAPGWTTLALEWIKKYASEHPTFISEVCTEASIEWGLVQPMNTKAWGAVFLKAAREGVIRKEGYGTSLRRHMSATPLWRSLVYRGAA